jgi:hypothetical protein
VTQTTGATDFLEQRQLRGKIVVLRSMPPPSAFGMAIWSQFLSDADQFASIWGDRALECGWSDEDLFGVHPAAPASRYDAMGLVLLIRGGEVVKLDSEIATVKTPGRSLLRFWRTRHVRGIPVWTLRPTLQVVASR